MDRGGARVREQDSGQKQALDQSIAVMAQPPPDLDLVAYDPEPVDRSDYTATSDDHLLALDARRQDLLDRELARRQRRTYSRLIFWLAVCWLFGVYAAVLGHGLQKIPVPGLGLGPVQHVRHNYCRRCSRFHSCDGALGDRDRRSLRRRSTRDWRSPLRDRSPAERSRRGRPPRTEDVQVITSMARTTATPPHPRRLWDRDHRHRTCAEDAGRAGSGARAWHLKYDGRRRFEAWPENAARSRPSNRCGMLPDAFSVRVGRESGRATAHPEHQVVRRARPVRELGVDGLDLGYEVLARTTTTARTWSGARLFHEADFHRPDLPGHPAGRWGEFWTGCCASWPTPDAACRAGVRLPEGRNRDSARLRTSIGAAHAPERGIILASAPRAPGPPGPGGPVRGLSLCVIRRKSVINMARFSHTGAAPAPVEPPARLARRPGGARCPNDPSSFCTGGATRPRRSSRWRSCCAGGWDARCPSSRWPTTSAWRTRCASTTSSTRWTRRGAGTGCRGGRAPSTPSCTAPAAWSSATGCSAASRRRGRPSSAS